MQALIRILSILLVTTPLSVFSQSKEFIIKGKLEGLNTPSKIYLVDPWLKTALDSAIVNNGEFELRGNVSEPDLRVLYLSKNTSGFSKTLRDAVSLYLEAGTIKVTNTKAQLSGSKVSDTPNNEAKIAFDEMIARISRPADEKIASLKKVTSNDQRLQQPFLAELALLEKQKIDTLIKYALEFIRVNSDALISVRTVSELSDFLDYPEVNALFNGFTSNIRESREGKIFAEKLALQKRVSLGSVAPDINLPDTSGTPVMLSSFRGKYLLVDVWASWCGPCRQENPNHVRTYQKFKGKNFTVIGVSLDDDRKSWINAIHKDGLPWTQVSDLKGWGGEIVSIYGLGSIPQNYLLDPNGVIIGKNLQGKDLQDKLNEILRNN